MSRAEKVAVWVLAAILAQWLVLIAAAVKVLMT